MIKKDFISEHFLIGGDWGAENQKHSHNYQIEIEIENKSLGKNNFLLDADYNCNWYRYQMYFYPK